jgi:hypothetical protein
LAKQETREEVVGGNGGAEFGKAGDEFGREIGGLITLLLAAGMFGAEGSERIRDGHSDIMTAGGDKACQTKS